MKRILIIRPSAIGDIVMASPMISILRQAYPKAHIAWLAEPHLKDLLRHNTDLDTVICWPKSWWEKLFKQGSFLKLAHEIEQFRRELQRNRFDLVLDAQGLLRSRFLAWLSGAEERIGFGSREPGKFLMTRIMSKGPSNKRMSSEYYHLMNEIGISHAFCRPKIAISRQDQQYGDAKLIAAGIEKRYAVFCPFTTRPQKHWLEERWVELARLLKERFNLPSIILGGPNDRDAAQSIQTLSREIIYNFTGTTTLGQSAALIKRATVIIGVDTGLTHMGGAFNRPTVALFGSTCPYLRTVNDMTTVIYHKHPCSPCKRNPVCDGKFDCMRSIDVDQVCTAVEQILGTSERSQ
jgi:heptosyltransferase-1